MNRFKTIKRDLYFTNDHEWIDFQGSAAYIGVCNFKLSGIKEIQQIEFKEYSNPLKQGEVVANIQFDDYRIPVHMPIDGKIIRLNDHLLTGDENLLLRQPENNGWIALIAPSKLHERKGLLRPEEYKLFSENFG